MTPGDRQPEPYRTKTGRILAEGELDALVAEAERGYDADELASRAGSPEHVVQVNPGDLAALREWLRHPNGAFIPREATRLTFEAVAGGGILVRSMPYQARENEWETEAMKVKREDEDVSP